LERLTDVNGCHGGLARYRCLTETELLFLGMALLVGGYETTAHQVTNMVYTLLTHDEQLRQLKARPELLPDAVEEMLRFTFSAAPSTPA
jgi:cytochrome P450